MKNFIPNIVDANNIQTPPPPTISRAVATSDRAREMIMEELDMFNNIINSRSQ